MKAIIILATFVGITANACPNLRGRYTCADNGRPSNMTVTQTNVYGPMEYLFLQNKEGSKIIADGVSHVVHDQADNDLIRTLTYSNSCASESLLYTFHEVEVDRKGNVVYESTGRHSTWVDQNNNLAMRLEHVDKAGHESATTSVCIRK